MGAPNVYDTRYVNSGPGVGLSSSDTRHSSNTSLSKGSGSYSGYTSNGGSGLASLAASVANAARTNPGAQYIRDQFDRPVSSAQSLSLYDSFLDQFGSSFDMDDYYDKILELTDFNNDWSANQAKIARQFEAEQAKQAMAFSDKQALRQMDYQTKSDAKAMAWSAEEAAKTRRWTEKLSNTAHQREMKDLLAAGLNPILAANQGAYTGSGATGQAFSSSGSSGSSSMAHGSMGQTDMSAGSVLSSLMSGIMNTARDLAVTKMSVDQSKYNTDMNYAMAKLSAGASIYNNNNTVSAQKAIANLNRDTDIQRANISADAQRASSAMSAGAMMSAAATNAAAARYSAEKHAEAAKYGSDKSSGASMYGSDRSLEGTKYSTDHDIKKNPVGYVGATANDLAKAFSNFDNVYSPGMNNDWNLLGSE